MSVAACQKGGEGGKGERRGGAERQRVWWNGNEFVNFFFFFFSFLFFSFLFFSSLFFFFLSFSFLFFFFSFFLYEKSPRQCITAICMTATFPVNTSLLILI